MGKFEDERINTVKKSTNWNVQIDESVKKGIIMGELFGGVMNDLESYLMLVRRGGSGGLMKEKRERN